jgi:hypothetical protein
LHYADTGFCYAKKPKEGSPSSSPEEILDTISRSRAKILFLQEPKEGFT